MFIHSFVIRSQPLTLVFPQHLACIFLFHSSISIAAAFLCSLLNTDPTAFEAFQVFRFAEHFHIADPSYPRGSVIIFSHLQPNFCFSYILYNHFTLTKAMPTMSNSSVQNIFQRFAQSSCQEASKSVSFLTPHWCAREL